MAFAFGGQRSIQLSYGCVARRGLSDAARLGQAPLCPRSSPLLLDNTRADQALGLERLSNLLSRLRLGHNASLTT